MDQNFGVSPENHSRLLLQETKEGGFVYEVSHPAYLRKCFGKCHKGYLYLFKDKTLFVGFSTLVFTSIKQFEIKTQWYGFQGYGIIVLHNCKHWVINKYFSGKDNDSISNSYWLRLDALSNILENSRKISTRVKFTS